jgi:hypothetical protein
MPNAAGQTSREPVSPKNAVLLLVDQQDGLLSRVHEPEQTHVDQPPLRSHPPRQFRWPARFVLCGVT